MPLLAEHRYRPASSMVTSVSWSERELSPLTNPSLISTVLSRRLHVITDAGLLDTLQFRRPEYVSLIWTLAVAIIGPSLKTKSDNN